MFYPIVACICFVALAASQGGYDDEAVERGNAYVDELLEDMFEKRDEEYDPYEIEDSSVGFSKKIMFVNVSGEAKLHDGHIKGLRTLHRPSDCSLEDDGERLKVKAELGAGVLDFHYSGTVKFMNFGPTITVQGTLSYIEVLMEFTVDSNTGKNGKLEKFVIDDMRGMKVWITGLGPLNWAVNPIISGVTKIFRRFVRNFLENKVEKHIAEHIPNFQFPVEGNDKTEIPDTKPTEPETSTPKESTQPPEPDTPAEPETTQPPEPETPAPEEPETPEPETPAPEEPETPAPEEPETLAPEEPETPAPEEPETPAPEEPETPDLEDENK